MWRKTAHWISLCILLSVIWLMSVAGCTSNQRIETFANNFRTNIGKESDAANAMVSDYVGINPNNIFSSAVFRSKLPSYVKTFYDCAIFYNSALPDNAPQDLKDAVDLARTGTEKLITGANIIDDALRRGFYDQLQVGENTFNGGVSSVNQSITKFNMFADAQNVQTKSSGGPNWVLGIIIGTAVLWLLGLLVVNPITKYFVSRKLAQAYAGGYQAQIMTDAQNIYNRIYILTDVIILGIAGLLMGLFAGWFFIGISWRARDWPGLIAFIGLSVLGSNLHG